MTWDEGRVALVNELNHLCQELEFLKIEEPVKSPINSDGGNSNGLKYFSLKNGESPEDNSYTTALTRKIAGHFSKKPDLSGHTQTEIPDTIESPLKNMSKEHLTTHYKQIVAEIKRENECIVEKKTNEIYKLKREVLRGSSQTTTTKKLLQQKRGITFSMNDYDDIDRNSMGYTLSFN